MLPKPESDEHQKQDEIMEMDEQNKFLSQYAQKKNKVCNRYFMGLVEQQIQCQECKSISRKLEEFLDIGVHMLDSSGTLQENLSANNTSFQPEVFNAENQNQYFCSACDKKVAEATKEYRILEYPDYLLVTLNRFKYQQGKLAKIMNQI